jgi:hypothetical protein
VKMEGGWNWIGIMPAFGISANERGEVFAIESEGMVVPPSMPPHRAKYGS